MNRIGKFAVSGLLAAALCVSSSAVRAGTGGAGKSYTTVVDQNIDMGTFNNIDISTDASQYSSSYSTSCYSSGCGADGYSGSNSWSYNLDQSVFSQNLSNAVTYFENLYSQTGQAPTADEFQAYLSSMTEQYAGTKLSGQTFTASGTCYGSDGCGNSVTESGVNGTLLSWAYGNCQYDGESCDGRSYQSYSDSTASASYSAGSASQNFSAAFTVSGDNQVDFISTGKYSGKTLEGNSVTVNGTVTGTVNANATGTSYSLAMSVSLSPIVLDMSGSGKLEASGGRWLPHAGQLVTSHMVMFDLLGDGFPLAAEWVGPDDGLLVAPKMGDCSVTHIDGTCLFGTPGGFANGYEKLEILDVRHEGKLTGDELNGLYVWQDKNGNGKPDPGELQSVQSLGITEIDVSHNPDMTSSFVRNGKRYTMWDWYPNALEVIKHRD